MGRFKKGSKQRRSNLWEKAGGTQIIIEKLQKSDILNRNTERSSDLWSELALSFFGDDSQTNRLWSWSIWTTNRDGVKEKVSAAAGVKRQKHQRATEEKPRLEGNLVIYLFIFYSA